MSEVKVDPYEMNTWPPKTNAQTLADIFQISCGEKDKDQDQETANPNKAISCFSGGA